MYTYNYNYTYNYVVNIHRPLRTRLVFVRAYSLSFENKTARRTITINKLCVYIHRPLRTRLVTARAVVESKTLGTLSGSRDALESPPFMIQKWW